MLEGTELESAVADNADAQEFREDPVAPVRAQVVSQEPAVELANGDADLSTTGACAEMLAGIVLLLAWLMSIQKHLCWPLC